MGHTWGQQHMHAFEGTCRWQHTFQGALHVDKVSIIDHAARASSSCRCHMGEVLHAGRGGARAPRSFRPYSRVSGWWLHIKSPAMLAWLSCPAMRAWPNQPWPGLAEINPAAMRAWLLWPWREISCLHISPSLYEPWPSPAELSCLAISAWLN